MGSRKTSPFTIEEKTWIMITFSKRESNTQMRIPFRNHFKVTPHNIHDLSSAGWSRGLRHGSVKTEDSQHDIKVMTLGTIRHLSRWLAMSFLTVWKIFSPTPAELPKVMNLDAVPEIICSLANL